MNKLPTRCNTLRVFPSQPDDIRETSAVDENTQPFPADFQRLIDIARANPNRGVLRARATANKAGLGLSTLWRDCKSGVFAAPIRISTRSVAWIEAEVDAILAAKTLMSRTAYEVDMKRFVLELTAPLVPQGKRSHLRGYDLDGTNARVEPSVP